MIRRGLVVPREAAGLVVELALADVEALQTAQAWTDPIPQEELTTFVQAAEQSFIDVLYGDDGLHWTSDGHDDDVLQRAEQSYTQAMAQLRADYLAEHPDVEDEHPDEEV